MEDPNNIIQNLNVHGVQPPHSAPLSNPAPPQPPPPDLPTPHPLPFLGDPTDFARFKLKLTHFFYNHQTSFPTPFTRVMFTLTKLEGAADKWLLNHVHPDTNLLPATWDFTEVLAELQLFFGGAATLQSRERDLRALRQITSVSDLAIAFQTITQSFNPRWGDHPLIFIFSEKLKENIRFELAARGAIPARFAEYVSAAIAVEQNQAAAVLSRNQQQPRLPFPSNQPTKPPPPPLRFPPSTPPLSHHVPMDLDATRGPRGPLTLDERQRRAAQGLCGYCGQSGHLIASCPAASRAGSRVQARSVQPLPQNPYYPSAGFQYLPADYQYMPAQQGPYPGPWMALPSPHTTFNPPAHQPKNDQPASQ